MDVIEKKIYVDQTEYLHSLLGDFDQNLKSLEKIYGVRILNRGCDLKVLGAEINVQKTVSVLQGMVLLLEKGEHLNQQAIHYIMNCVDQDHSIDAIRELADTDCIGMTAALKPIKPKSINQKIYLQAIEQHPLVFGVGPAGTGKTYLAVAMAVQALKKKQVSRIILTRPAVEAGESLGFLPGDLQTKVDPYLRPLYDALFEMLGEEGFHRQLEKGNIEVAPLAYMRGRSLNEAFIILDEAQNTTSPQMKMFLTRMGFRSKVVVTGDLTQIDLPHQKPSGLLEATRILQHLDQVAMMFFTDQDVVRSKMVQDIIRAYDQDGQHGQQGQQGHHGQQGQHGQQGFDQGLQEPPQKIKKDLIRT